MRERQTFKLQSSSAELVSCLCSMQGTRHQSTLQDTVMTFLACNHAFCLRARWSFSLWY